MSGYHADQEACMQVHSLLMHAGAQPALFECMHAYILAPSDSMW